MSPIQGLTEQKRLPRLGKIHLGVKKTNAKGTEYPSPTDYFVCPPEIQKVYGEKPQKLDIIIPVEDEDMWASQYYRQYSRTRGLVCRGDGITCRRMVDTETGDTANRDSKTITWKEELPCPGRDCPDYQRKACQEVMNLQFLLPRVPGLGIWQVDTGSINSIRNVNNCAAMVRAVCDRISWIPLTLTLEPTEVTNPDDGKKKIVQCLNLRSDKGLPELLEASGKAKADLLITAPIDNEAPLDNEDSKVIEGEVVGVREEEPEQEPQPEPPEQPTRPSAGESSIIDLNWWEETLTKLEEHGVVAWEREKILKYINTLLPEEEQQDNIYKAPKALERINPAKAKDLVAQAKKKLKELN